MWKKQSTGNEGNSSGGVGWCPVGNTASGGEGREKSMEASQRLTSSSIPIKSINVTGLSEPHRGGGAGGRGWADDGAHGNATLTARE